MAFRHSSLHRDEPIIFRRYHGVLRYLVHLPFLLIVRYTP